MVKKVESTDRLAVVKQMLADCVKHKSRLTNWGRGFISNISIYVNTGGLLSSKQEATLVKIHATLDDYLEQEEDNNMGDC
jgi:hypothetical protein